MADKVVTEYLISLIAKQVADNGLLVWYNPTAHREIKLAYFPKMSYFLVQENG